MHKRLIVLIAILLLPIFITACEEQGTESKVDKETLAATLQKAMDNAKELDNITLKSFGMAKVGAGMATVDPAKAGQALNEAMMLANQTRLPKYAAVLEELKTTTADWPAAEKDQVADAIDRIEKDTTRVWLYRVIAEGVMVNDSGAARGILMGAADKAVNIPDKKYRDLDLRSVAILMAKADLESARNIAGRIDDPRVKCAALTEIGSMAAKSDPSVAAIILAAAAEEAKSIPRGVEPSTALLVPDVSEETRKIVEGSEAAKITSTSARMLAAVAVAMNAVDSSQAGATADAAADIAKGIDEKAYPYTRAYAMSDVAIELTKFDANRAKTLEDAIDSNHPDARAAALIAIIKAKSASANTNDLLSEISDAVNVAEGITDEYDRAKSLAALAELTIPASKERAAEIAGSIEESLGEEKYAFSMIKDDVLGDVAVAWTGEDDATATAMLEPKPTDYEKAHEKYVVETRFAKNRILYTKAEAYLKMADKKLASDQHTALRYYNKAASNAADAKSTRLQWEVARRLCKINPDNLFDYAAAIPPGDYQNQAEGLADIAADWSSKGNTSSGMVWGMAAKAANTLGDNMESSELLNKVAAQCAAYDKAKATEIYAMSMQRIVKIGAEE